MKKECCMCSRMRMYYTRGMKRFYKTNVGWCCEKRENVTIHGSCEKFTEKPERTIDNRMRNRVNDILTEIREIKNVLEEERFERAEENIRIIDEYLKERGE